MNLIKTILNIDNIDELDIFLEKLSQQAKTAFPYYPVFRRLSNQYRLHIGDIGHQLLPWLAEKGAVSYKNGLSNHLQYSVGFPLEGLSQEEQKSKLAKKFAKIAMDTLNFMIQNGKKGFSLPENLTKKAVQIALRKNLIPKEDFEKPQKEESWERQGNRILLKNL